MDEFELATRLLTIDEVCLVLKTGRTTVYQLLGDGQIRSLTIGKRRLVPMQEIDRFISERMAS